MKTSDDDFWGGKSRKEGYSTENQEARGGGDFVSRTGGSAHSQAAWLITLQFVFLRQQSEPRVLKLLPEDADQLSICVHSLSGLDFFIALVFEGLSRCT